MGVIQLGENQIEVQVNSLHSQGVKVATQFTRCEFEMVEILSKLHVAKAHLHFKCESLRQYVIVYWRLSEYIASDLVTVAKKACEVPAMLEALQSRKASVSKLRKVCPVINESNFKEWLDLVAACSSRIIERCVAMANPKTAEKDRARYKSGTLVELTVDIQEELWLEMKRMQDILSQKKRRAVSLSEAMAFLAEMGLEKYDPLRKAERAMERERKRRYKHAVSQTATIQTATAETATTGVKITESSTEIPVMIEMTIPDAAGTELVPGRAQAKSEALLSETADISAKPAADMCVSIAVDSSEIDSSAIANSLIAHLAGDEAQPDKTPKIFVPGREIRKWTKKSRKKCAATSHRVYLRDGGQCTHLFTSVGTSSAEAGSYQNLQPIRCENRRWLEVL